MQYADPQRQRQAAAAIGVALVHAVIGYLVITGSIGATRAPPSEELIIFEVAPTALPPPEQPKPAAARAPKRQGAASAANRTAKASPVVAPPPKVHVEVPPPIAAAPTPATGADTAAGAAPIVGPGSGSGGVGTGTGSGLEGSGPGGGGGSRARWLKGRIRDSDYPRAASKAGVGGMVVAHFDVGIDGSVSNCRVVASSGNRDLDATTCRLIEKRFRYQPATNAQGEPVPDVAGWQQTWWLEES